jgi:uncharacterized protein
MPPENKYTTPGIFIEEISSFRHSIPVLHTSVTAFVGSAASNQYLLIPKKIVSLTEYLQIFAEEGELLPHLQLYFENGGGECFVLNAEAQDFLPALQVLKELEEVTLIVIPQMTSLAKENYAALAKAMLTHCGESINRFAILDVYGATEYSDYIIAEHRKDVGDENLRYAASYFPFLLANDGGQPIPASAAVAGIFCKMDRERGIWKSPANTTVIGVREPAVLINELQQELLNVDAITGKSINAIRLFTGKGTVVWGARTLAGNDNEWRYIAVQRFLSWVKACVQKGLEPFAFEENNAATWTHVKAMTENFLINLWRQGALVGTKPEEAFFVHAGLGQTMTEQDITEGRLMVEIGLAAVRPAEFIILRFGQQHAVSA